MTENNTTAPTALDTMTRAATASNLLNLVDAWLDQATAYTCGEADLIAEFLTAWADERTGRMFLAAHAEGDDEGDAHVERDGLVTVLLTSTYSDREHVETAYLDASTLPDDLDDEDAIEAWLIEHAMPLTGDGHGADEYASYEVEIVRAPFAALVGRSTSAEG